MDWGTSLSPPPASTTFWTIWPTAAKGLATIPNAPLAPPKNLEMRSDLSPGGGTRALATPCPPAWAPSTTAVSATLYGLPLRGAGASPHPVHTRAGAFHHVSSPAHASPQLLDA